jgi:hypothetical protein
VSVKSTSFPRPCSEAAAELSHAPQECHHALKIV